MDDTIRTAAAHSVKGRAHQAYDLNVSVTFVPPRDIPNFIVATCLPRQGAQRIDVRPVDLPEATRRFLLEAGKAVTEWLARDPSHQAAFLADPVNAFAKAGIALERSHAKAISRVREALVAAETVTPGLQLRTVRTSVNPKGRVKRDPDDRPWTPPPADDDCDCNKQEGK